MMITIKQHDNLVASLEALDTWNIKKYTRNKNDSEYFTKYTSFSLKDDDFDYRLVMDNRPNWDFNDKTTYNFSFWYNNFEGGGLTHLTDEQLLNEFVSHFHKDYKYRLEKSNKNVIKFKEISSDDMLVALDYFKSTGCNEIVDWLEDKKPIKVKSKSIQEQLTKMSQELVNLALQKV